MGRDEDMVSGPHFDTLAGEVQDGSTFDKQHPFVMVLIV